MFVYVCAWQSMCVNGMKSLQMRLNATDYSFCPVDNSESMDEPQGSIHSSDTETGGAT